MLDFASIVAEQVDRLGRRQLPKSIAEEVWQQSRCSLTCPRMNSAAANSAWTPTFRFCPTAGANCVVLIAPGAGSLSREKYTGRNYQGRHSFGRENGAFWQIAGCEAL